MGGGRENLKSEWEERKAERSRWVFSPFLQNDTQLDFLRLPFVLSPFSPRKIVLWVRETQFCLI